MDPNLYLGEPSEDDGPDVFDYTTLCPISTPPQHQGLEREYREALDAFGAIR